MSKMWYVGCNLLARCPVDPGTSVALFWPHLSQVAVRDITTT